MKKLYDALNKQVSNFSVLFTKLHHYHWYVTGPSFYELHEKFEELYNEVNAYYDEFAERLLAIGGQPASNMKTYLELTSLKEATESDTKKMVTSLIGDLKILSLELRELTKIAQDADDEQTADMSISTTTAIDKHLWMLTFFNK